MSDENDNRTIMETLREEEYLDFTDGNENETPPPIKNNKDKKSDEDNDTPDQFKKIDLIDFDIKDGKKLPIEQVYAKLKRNTIDYKYSKYELALASPDKENFYKSIYADNEQPSNTTSALGIPLGKFAELGIKYSVNESEKIREDYEKSVNKHSTSFNKVMGSEFNFNNTPEAAKMHLLELGEWLEDNQNKDFASLKNIPDNISARDKHKIIMDKIMAGEIDDIPQEHQKTLLGVLSPIVTASQQTPDIDKLTPKETQNLAKNILPFKFLVRTDLKGYDLTKFDEEKLNPKGHLSAYMIREELLKLSDTELLKRLNGVLDGKTLEEFKKSLANAQIKDLLEHTSPKDKSATTEALKSLTVDMASKPASHIIKKTVSTIENSNDLSDAAIGITEYLAFSAPFDIMVIMLENIEKALKAKAVNSVSRAKNDQSYGRLIKSYIPPALAKSIVNDTYSNNKNTSNAKDDIIVKASKLEEGTQIISIGEHVVVDNVVTKPLAGSPIPPKSAIKKLQEVKDNIPRSVVIRDPATSNLFVFSADNKTTEQDFINAMSDYNNGKSFNSNAMNDRNKDKIFQKQLMDEQGQVLKNMKAPLHDFILAIDKDYAKKHALQNQGKSEQSANNIVNNEKRKELTKKIDNSNKKSTIERYHDVEKKIAEKLIEAYKTGNSFAIKQTSNEVTNIHAKTNALRNQKQMGS